MVVVGNQLADMVYNMAFESKKRHTYQNFTVSAAKLRSFEDLALPNLQSGRWSHHRQEDGHPPMPSAQLLDDCGDFVKDAQTPLQAAARELIFRTGRVHPSVTSRQPERLFENNTSQYPEYNTVAGDEWLGKSLLTFSHCSSCATKFSGTQSSHVTKHSDVVDCCIDTALFDLVEALNAQYDIKTRHSCQGYLMYSPYDNYFEIIAYLAADPMDTHRLREVFSHAFLQAGMENYAKTLTKAFANPTKKCIADEQDTPLLVDFSRLDTSRLGTEQGYGVALEMSLQTMLKASEQITAGREISLPKRSKIPARIRRLALGDRAYV